MADRLTGVILAPRPETQGAVPRIAAWLAEELNADGWSVEVWPWGKHREGESIPAKLLSRANDILVLAHRVRQAHPDFVVIKSGLDWKSVLRDVVLSRVIRSNVPVVVLHPHGSQMQRLASPRHRVFRIVVRWLLANVDGVFVLSRQERELLLRFSPGVAVHVVDNPYDPSSLGDTHRVLEVGRFTVMFAGRLVAEKGVMELVGAAADIDGRGALDTVIFGEGSAREEALALAAQLNASDYIRLLGVASREELAAAYRHADVLVLPSYTEGFPTVVTEAMSFGLPIVCTRIRGLEDHLTEGVNALFVTVGDPVDLREKLLALRNDPALAARMGESNRDLVRRFAPPIAAARYRSAIEQVAAMALGCKKDGHPA